MSVSRTELLCAQSESTRSVFEYHLERLEREDFLREPAPHCWTMRPCADGTWISGPGGRVDTAPGPVPVPTIAWVSRPIG